MASGWLRVWWLKREKGGLKDGQNHRHNKRLNTHVISQILSTELLINHEWPFKIFQFYFSKLNQLAN